MISVSVSQIQLVISRFSKEINDFVLAATNNLNELKNDNKKKYKLNALEKKYIRALIADLDNIVKAKPNKLEDLKKIFKLPNSRNKKRQKKFKDDVLKALGYNSLRTNFYPTYFQKIDIKACVYCNSQLTVTVERKSGKVSQNIAKFQVDHFIDKASYPCFSISLFNLYPTCASCNNIKGAKKNDFNLYTDLIPLGESPFKFVLDETSRSNFLLSRKSEDLKILFNQPPTPLDYENYKELFAIEGIYDTQKDIAEELIIKAEVYKPSYKQSLVQSFSKIFTDASLNNRLIIGNYMEKSEIHKRPLTKFMQDIARQLKLI